jgi:hypothetical protein
LDTSDRANNVFIIIEDSGCLAVPPHLTS